MSNKFSMPLGSAKSNKNHYTGMSHKNERWTRLVGDARAKTVDQTLGLI